jgi:hypothetical protein
MGTTIGVLVLLVALSNMVMLIQLGNRVKRLAQPQPKATRKPRVKKETLPTTGVEL